MEMGVARGFPPAMQRNRKQARRVFSTVLCVCALVLLSGAKRAKEAEVQLRFGVDMAQQGSWKEAQFRFEKAAKLAPEDPEILNNLAVAYENNGDYSLAEETYLKALELDAANARIRDNYEHFRVFYEEFTEHRKRRAEPEAVAEEPEGAGGDGDSP